MYGSIPVFLLRFSKQIGFSWTRVAAQDSNFPGETVTIIQPVSIAEGCTIKSSVIGPHVTIGKDCVLENVILRNSIVEAGTSIHNMVIKDSLIGKKVVLKGRAEQFNIGDDTGFNR